MLRYTQLSDVWPAIPRRCLRNIVVDETVGNLSSVVRLEAFYSLTRWNLLVINGEVTGSTVYALKVDCDRT